MQSFVPWPLTRDNITCRRMLIPFQTKFGIYFFILFLFNTNRQLNPPSALFENACSSKPHIAPRSTLWPFIPPQTYKKSNINVLKHNTIRYQIAQAYSYTQRYLNNVWSEMITPCVIFNSNSTHLVDIVHMWYFKFHFPQTIWDYLNVTYSHTSNLYNRAIYIYINNLDTVILQVVKGLQFYCPWWWLLSLLCKCHIFSNGIASHNFK